MARASATGLEVGIVPAETAAVIILILVVSSRKRRGKSGGGGDRRTGRVGAANVSRSATAHQWLRRPASNVESPGAKYPEVLSTIVAAWQVRRSGEQIDFD